MGVFNPHNHLSGEYYYYPQFTNEDREGNNMHKTNMHKKRFREGNNMHKNTQLLSARVGILTQDGLVWLWVLKSYIMVLVNLILPDLSHFYLFEECCTADP